MLRRSLTPKFGFSRGFWTFSPPRSAAPTETDGTQIQQNMGYLAVWGRISQPNSSIFCWVIFETWGRSVVAEVFCRRCIHTMMSQHRVHVVQLFLVELSSNCWTRIQKLKIHQSIIGPSNTKLHLISLYTQFCSRLWGLTSFQPLPLSCIFVVTDPFYNRHINWLKKPLFLERRGEFRRWRRGSTCSSRRAHAANHLSCRKTQ